MKCAQRETSSGERGIVLVVSILGLLMLTLIGLAITTMGIVSTDIATNLYSGCRDHPCQSDHLFPGLHE